jgi:hypothetical protein
MGDKSDYKDAVRNPISLDGDANTLACIPPRRPYHIPRPIPSIFSRDSEHESSLVRSKVKPPERHFMGGRFWS